MVDSLNQVVRPARSIRGRLCVPGDKSISHRALMLGALATGVSRIRGLAPGDDCRATRACLQALGVTMVDAGTPRDLTVEGRGLRGLRAPATDLDAQNSGTTSRLLMGILAAHAFTVTITGDASLRRRPMRRVTEPLAAMGGRVETTDGRLPATIYGRALRGITFTPSVPSAQVKTAVLLAGLQAEGVTTVVESTPTRDHTERALRLFGADARVDRAGVSVTGGIRLRAVDLTIPGDPSSAAFFAAAAAALPGSRIDVEGVSLNPSRIGFLEVLRRFGARVSTHVDDDDAIEPSGSMTIEYGETRPIVIEAAEVPGLIDELPVLGAMAALGGGLTVRGAAELRVKESDRIRSLVAGLRALGAHAEEYPDGFAISAGQRLSGGVLDAAGDHRLAMSFAVAALGADGHTTIRGAEAVTVSYPGFFGVLEGLCG